MNATDNNKSIASLRVDEYPESPPFRLAIPAKFPSEINAWNNYLSSNTNYPREALKNNLEGIVKVEYTIDVNGNIISVQSINNLGYGLLEEAERVIRASPKWKPAKLDGKAIEYRFIQNIIFKLN